MSVAETRRLPWKELPQCIRNPTRPSWTSWLPLSLAFRSSSSTLWSSYSYGWATRRYSGGWRSTLTTPTVSRIPLATGSWLLASSLRCSLQVLCARGTISTAYNYSSQSHKDSKSTPSAVRSRRAVYFSAPTTHRSTRLGSVAAPQVRKYAHTLVCSCAYFGTRRRRDPAPTEKVVRIVVRLTGGP